MQITKAPPNWALTTRTDTSRITTAICVLTVIALAALPFLAGRALVQDMFQILTLLILAQCWNLLAGYSGLVSVGQQAFVGIGAYVFFTFAVFAPVPPLLGLLVAGLIALLVAVPIALFAFRLNGAYFAVGTWVAAEVVRLLLAKQAWLGGGSGMSLPPALRETLPGYAAIRDLGFAKSVAIDVIAYWMALGLCIVSIFGIYRFMCTPAGLGLASVRDNVLAARSIGVNAGRLRWQVYLSASFMTGITGALIFLQKQSVTPDTGFAVIDWSAFVIFVVVIGGIGTLEGPILGVLVFYFLQSTLADLGPIYLIILGVVGIVSILVAPQGLWGLISRRLGIEMFPTGQRLKRNSSVPASGG
jgi:branched-chain amino acid transport system permease protein